MNMSRLTRILLFVVLSVNLSNSSPLERLKRALNKQNAGACPPGIWTCDAVADEPQESVPHEAQLNSESRGCPPGIWTCLNGDSEKRMAAEGVAPAAERAAVKPDGDSLSTELRRGTKQRGQPIASDNDEDDVLEDGPNPKCPPGFLVCKRKRMLKKMQKEAQKRFQRSAQKCPPGIWVC